MTRLGIMQIAELEIHMNLTFLIASVLVFVYSLRFSYFWWFQSKDYVRMNRRKRREYQKNYFLCHNSSSLIIMTKILNLKY